MVPPPQVIWHGTSAEGLELVAAIARNCECVTNLGGVTTSMCSPHKAMLDDQRFMDGVLAYRHQREALLCEEWTTVRKHGDG
jgi:hypothetical protein